MDQLIEEVARLKRIIMNREAELYPMKELEKRVAALERGEVPTLDRQNMDYAISSDNSIIQRGNTYSFWYKGHESREQTVAKVGRYSDEELWFETSIGNRYACSKVTRVRKVYPRSNTHADGTTSITTGSGPVKGFGSFRDEGGKITKVLIYPSENMFAIGDTTRLYNLDFNIDGFAQTADNYYASLSGPCQLTVPLSDLIPLTTGGQSAGWAGRHGVKEWEITAFRATKPDPNQHIDIYALQNRLYGPTGQAIYTLNQMMTGDARSVATGDWEIYEVKRLSDGSVWKLGDETEQGVIKRFSVIDDSGNIAVWFEDIIGGHCISDLKKSAGKPWNIIKIRRRSMGDIFTWNGDTFGSEQGYVIPSYNVDKHDIVSVHRVSDNTKWSVDDETQFGKIERFFINSHDEMVAALPKASYSISHLMAAPSVKEWEIVEFRTYSDKSNWILEHGYYVGQASKSKQPLDNMLTGKMSVEDGCVFIHSVRRLSDSATFTIGDRLNLGTITRFEIVENIMWCRGDDFGVLLTHAEKASPLFTTADGVDAYWDTEVFALSFGGKYDVIRGIAKDVLHSHRANAYASRESAQAAYDKWLFEQPVLTLADITEGNDLIQLVKDKLAKK